MTTQSSAQSSGLQAASLSTTGLRCSKCNGDHVRRSKRKRDDGLMHRLFFHAHRCRDCRHRFWRVDSTRVAVASVVVIVIGTVIAGGLALDEHFENGTPTSIADADIRTVAPAATPEPRRPPTTSPVASPGLLRLAEQGDARAQFNLGLAYVNGQGVVKNMTLAVAWFEKAGQQGLADAQYALGSMYVTGRGVRQNFETAFRWFEKAAQQNHGAAQYETGVMYRTGNGVATDKTKAYVWFNLAAAQGNTQATIERDRLLPTMTSEQVALGQRLAHSWRPTAGKN